MYVFYFDIKLKKNKNIQYKNNAYDEMVDTWASHNLVVEPEFSLDKIKKKVSILK